MIEKVKYLIDGYMERLTHGTTREFDIKWDRETTKYLERKISKSFQETQVIESLYRPYVKQYLYFDRHFNGMTYQLPSIFPIISNDNKVIWIKAGSEVPFFCLITNCIPDLLPQGGSQCLPLYRYDENGERIDNITDWGLMQFQTHYQDPKITKENIFHYTYAVLHHPAYRTKYELNLSKYSEGFNLSGNSQLNRITSQGFTYQGRSPLTDPVLHNCDHSDDANAFTLLLCMIKNSNTIDKILCKRKTCFRSPNG